MANPLVNDGAAFACAPCLSGDDHCAVVCLPVSLLISASLGSLHPGPNSAIAHVRMNVVLVISDDMSCTSHCSDGHGRENTMPRSVCRRSCAGSDGPRRAQRTAVLHRCNCRKVCFPRRAPRNRSGPGVAVVRIFVLRYHQVLVSPEWHAAYVQVTPL